MAKLRAPLFSFGASGQIAKALVYFPWKGIAAVRSYVVPANPDTQAQKDQRALMTAAVAEWHGAAYTAADITAWDRLAGIGAKIMSGFNDMVRRHIVEALLTNVWERIHHVTTPLIQANNFDVRVEKAAGGNTPVCHYGTRKTHFPNTQAIGSDAGDFWRTTIAGLTANTLYYLYIDVGTTATDYGRTGIFQVRTLAA